MDKQQQQPRFAPTAAIQVDKELIALLLGQNHPISCQTWDVGGAQVQGIALAWESRVEPPHQNTIHHLFRPYGLYLTEVHGRLSRQRIAGSHFRKPFCIMQPCTQTLHPTLRPFTLILINRFDSVHLSPTGYGRAQGIVSVCVWGGGGA